MAVRTLSAGDPRSASAICSASLAQMVVPTGRGHLGRALRTLNRLALREGYTAVDSASRLFDESVGVTSLPTSRRLEAVDYCCGALAKLAALSLSRARILASRQILLPLPSYVRLSLTFSSRGPRKAQPRPPRPRCRTARTACLPHARTNHQILFCTRILRFVGVRMAPP